MMQSRLWGNLDLKKLLALGAGLVALTFFLPGLPSLGVRNADLACQQGIQPNAKRLTVNQVAQLMTRVQQGDPKKKVRSLIKDPHCKLTNVKVRSGMESEREVYILDDTVIEGEANAKLIVLYEDNAYTGYRFLVR